MTSQSVLLAMNVAEFSLWAALAFLFWRKALHRRFPAMAAYVALHVVSLPLCLAAFQMLAAHPSSRSYYAIYTGAYFAVYIASAGLLYFICMEIFRSALSAFPGLSKIGIAVFRWAALLSVVVSLTALTKQRWGISGSFSQGGVALAASASYALMHSVSILELCLLAFLCLGMNALRLSVRDMSFGIALGFGLISANDFVGTSLISHNTALAGPLQIVYEAAILATLLIWTVYSAMPEPERRPVVVPASSRIYRWNEIASALGHTGTQVAVQQPANSFFLTDVEKVVEKVLNKNLKGRESEL